MKLLFMNIQNFSALRLVRQVDRKKWPISGWGQRRLLLNLMIMIRTLEKSIKFNNCVGILARHSNILPTAASD